MPIKDKNKYRAYMKKYMLRRYHAKRLLVIKKLGSKCSKCGTRKNLEIDHVDSSIKNFSVSKFWSLNKARMAEEIDKCQLLCATCHKIKTSKYDRRPARCGTEYKYNKHKCRCVRCKFAHMMYLDR